MGDVIPFPNKKADSVGHGFVKPETDSAISDLMMKWVELGVLDVSDFDGIDWELTDLTGIMSVPVPEETEATTLEIVYEITYEQFMQELYPVPQFVISDKITEPDSTEPAHRLLAEHLARQINDQLDETTGNGKRPHLTLVK